MNYCVPWAVLLDTRPVAGVSRADRDFPDDELAHLGELRSQLHDETAGETGLSDADRETLKGMSIRLTHA
jgi:hypothetical protein